MQQLFNILIIIHIAGGTLGLIAGTIAAAVVKGKKIHILAGRLFTTGMLAAAVSALIISNLPDHNNIFLFAVGGFTFYMVTTAWRIIAVNKNKNAEKVFTPIDYLLFIFGLGFALFLIYLAATGIITGNTFNIVPGVFGLICLSFVWKDYQLLSGKSRVKQVWLYNHITRMMGAMIASYTAFLVVNVQIDMQWILWLLPTLIGSILITKFVRKYVPKKLAG
ncbi:hypothetical protein [Limnovirga soli]|uniref:DUF2306 domain-containing protein n=1 Tax=Limnovirga soli TaxID=2656915 RepID=A0A8J8FED8_9BACT|nr:hypothetical protein [Limnovirga soli]NNV54421.1 hypothetical protein [Limnovirga soli]